MRQAAVEAADEDGEAPMALDILDVLDAMSFHFHEHHEAILRWSWKLFCAKWVRLMAAMARLREREAEAQRERAFAALRAEHSNH